MPEPSGVDHIKTFALVAACEASNASGRPMVMQEFYEQHGVPAAVVDRQASQLLELPRSSTGVDR